MSSASAVAALPQITEPSANLRELTDEQLLARFFRDHIDAAFSAIVERYGPLVLGVCRRVLNDANDAEDAFQATFLVLVRKGATLRDPGRLSSWLYGVAFRTARKVKAKAAVRTKSERKAGEMPTKSAAADMTYEELQAILDEEISQLPEKYALPLVLCYLEGKTNAQAAAQLGWPERFDLAAALASQGFIALRLAKRGLGITAALIAAVFARPASAAPISSELLSATTRAAALVAEGVELEEVVSPATAKVVQDVVAGMSRVGKFTIPTIAVVASMVLVITTAIWQFGSPLQAASLFDFGRQSSPHGLMAHPGSGTTPVVTMPISSSEGSCASTCSAAPVPTALPPSGGETIP